MTDQNQSRQPAGVPTGGQFATSTRAESSTVLTAPLNEHPAVVAAIAQAKETGKPVRIDSAALPGCSYDAGENGSACGDTSLGAEPSNRATWATGNDQEPFITVTETFYVTGRRNGEAYDLDHSDLADAVTAQETWLADGGDESMTVQYGVDSQTEWIAHTDVDDPGQTEVRSDYHYEKASSLTYSTTGDAEKVARNHAEHVNFDRDYAPENWK